MPLPGKQFLPCATHWTTWRLSFTYRPTRRVTYCKAAPQKTGGHVDATAVQLCLLLSVKADSQAKANCQTLEFTEGSCIFMFQCFTHACVASTEITATSLRDTSVNLPQQRVAVTWVESLEPPARGWNSITILSKYFCRWSASYWAAANVWWHL